MAVVQGVGYPNPNRSHFRSTEIWQTASDSDRSRPYGWLGTYFDSCCEGAPPTVGVAIGGQMPQAFNSAHPTGISFANPEQYRWIDKEGDKSAATAAEHYFREINAPGTVESGENGGLAEDMAGGSIGAISGGGAAHAGGEMGSLDFLERTALDAQLSSDKVLEIARKARPQASYPNSKLADSLSLVARMIAGGLPTRVYYVSHGGYDTHQSQAQTHERLMKELGDAVGAFCTDLKAQGNFGRVMLMTFSEFGRARAAKRERRNGSRSGRADVHVWRRSAAGSLRPVPEPYRPVSGRHQVQRGFPQRLRHRARALVEGIQRAGCSDASSR